MITESPSAGSRQEFCGALKAVRQRKGITLDEIAETTKIPAYLFAGLEAGDLHRWPRGLFRRSFFRDYARALGMPVAETCDQFVRLFPDEEAGDLTKVPGATDAAEHARHLRLVLDPGWRGPRTSILLRLLAGAIDAAAVLAVTAALVRVGGMAAFEAIGVVSLAYLLVGTVLLGASPAAFVLTARRSIVDAIACSFGNAGSVTPETEEAAPRREWISDARRVGPPRLRVRIKVSP